MDAPMGLLELHDAIAKAIADAIGHGMREKCERHADAVLVVVGPQLLATAEHAERIKADERAAASIRPQRCSAHVIHPKPSPPGPGNPPLWCCLREGHDGPHRHDGGGMYPSIPFRENDEVSMIAATHPPAQAALVGATKLDKPARVGAVTFGTGVPWSSVIGAAQRAYDVKLLPPETVEKLREILKTAAEPRAQMDVARFGHHPDPATDFCVEVEALLGEIENHRIGFENGTPPRAELEARIERALSFRVGGDPHAVMAKQQLRAATIAEPVAQGEATKVKQLTAEIDSATKLLAPYFKNVDPMPGDCMIGVSRTVTLYGYARDVVEQLKAAQPRAVSADFAEYLKDPANVHVMMLRGVIAIPSIRSIVHLRGEVPNGEDAQLARIAELQEQVATLKDKPAERVVDGMVLVPVEPTPKMLAAVAGMEISVRVAEDDTAEYPVPEDDCAEIYRNMLAAAPSPGESE